MLDDKGKLMRTFEVCNVNQNPRLQDNWLATPFLYRQSAPRIFVTLRFSVRDCASLRSPSPTCRETLTLYYKQADSQRELERTWVAEVSDKGLFHFQDPNGGKSILIGLKSEEACDGINNTQVQEKLCV